MNESATKLFVLLISLIIISACRESEEPTIEKEIIQWEEDDRFLFEYKSQFNIHTKDKSILFLGNRSLTEIKLEDSVETTTHYYLWAVHNQDYKMPLTDDFSLTAEDETLAFIPVKNPVSGSTGYYLNLHEVDTSFRNFQFYSFGQSPVIAINDKGVCLIPYQTYEDFGNKLLLVTPEINEVGGTYYVNVKKTTIIDYPLQTNGSLRVFSFDENFYLYDGLNGLWKIDSNQNISLVSNEPIQNIFKMNDTLYGISSDKIFTSANGDNWNLFSNEIPIILRSIPFYQIEGRTVGNYRSQFFEFTVE